MGCMIMPGYSQFRFPGPGNNDNHWVLLPRLSPVFKEDEDDPKPFDEAAATVLKVGEGDPPNTPAAAVLKVGECGLPNTPAAAVLGKAEGLFLDEEVAFTVVVGAVEVGGDASDL